MLLRNVKFIIIIIHCKVKYNTWCIEITTQHSLSNIVNHCLILQKAPSNCTEDVGTVSRDTPVSCKFK